MAASRPIRSYSFLLRGTSFTAATFSHESVGNRYDRLWADAVPSAKFTWSIRIVVLPTGRPWPQTYLPARLCPRRIVEDVSSVVPCRAWLPSVTSAACHIRVSQPFRYHGACLIKLRQARPSLQVPCDPEEGFRQRKSALLHAPKDTVNLHSALIAIPP